MIQWQYYPKSLSPPNFLVKVVDCFRTVEENINSERHGLSSDEVLVFLRHPLEEIGFNVEKGKKKDEKISVPVLFGRNGVPEKSFEADAYHAEMKTVVEIEAGRGVTN